MRTLCKTLGICFLCCFLSGIPVYTLVYRVEAYSEKLADVVRLINTEYGIDDWTVTPPYRSERGYYDLGTYEYQDESINLWVYLANNIYIDDTTGYGNNHYGYESYKVVALYPLMYYVSSDGVNGHYCIRATLEGTYRSGFLGFIGAQVGKIDVYIPFQEDWFYFPNVNGDSLARAPHTVGWSVLEETAEYPYSAEETEELLIDYLKGTFD